MKELKPLHTFVLTAATIVILVGISFISPPDNALWGIKKIDLFSALRTPDSALGIEEPACVTDDYSVDYVRNDIVANRTKNSAGTAEPKQPARANSTGTEDSLSNTKTNEQPSDSVASSPFEIAHSTITKPHDRGELIDTPDHTNHSDKANNSDHTVSTSTSASTSTSTQQPSKEQSVKLTTESSTKIENAGALSSFFSKLRGASSASRPIRIAVLGDSFIEGDIFTQDLREMFQDRFGGNGVGFVPMASSVSGFRQTITHTFSGWTTRCISTSARRGDYSISSYTYTPSDGSISRYATTEKRRHIDHFSRARLMFVNSGSGSITSRVNSGTKQSYNPASVARMQQITIAQDSITSIEFSFRPADAMTVYGVYLDGVNGVAVDNYSVRGNSGISLASTSIEMMSQMNSLLPVDLIILEYGLNVAQADTRNYNQYHSQMLTAIKHLQTAYPNTAILILSVADRAHRTAAGWQTMPGIKAMDATQRQLAADCGVAFWSTMKNMQALGGMGKFVDKGWAAKDYTHLSHKGGRVVARALFDAIMVEYEN